MWFFVPALVCGTFSGTLTLFNIFVSTRNLVRTTLSVLYDLIPFLLLLFGFVFIFASIFIAMEREGEELMAQSPYVNEFLFIKAIFATWDFAMGYSSYRF